MAKRGGFPGGMMPGNMSNLMKQAQKMQQTAKAGGGAVEVTVSGKRELTKVTIDPEAVDPDDVEMLQDMIIAAANEALRAAEDDAAKTMGGLAGGMGGMGGFGF